MLKITQLATSWKLVNPPQKNNNQCSTKLCVYTFLQIIGIIKNSPIRGWGRLSKMSNKMSNKMSKIELSQLGQDLFDFSGLTWAYPLTHPSTHR